MVRPKDQKIWKHFRDPRDKSAICKYCEHKYKFAHIAKMRNHLLKCTGCPDNIKEDLEKKHLEAAANGGILSMRNIEDDVHKRIISLTKIAAVASSDNVVPDPDIENIKTEDDDSRPDYRPDATIGIESFDASVQPAQMSTPHDTDEETEKTTHKESIMDPLEVHVDEEPDSMNISNASVLWKLAVEKRQHIRAMRNLEIQIKKEILKQEKIKTRMMLLELQLKRKQMQIKNKQHKIL